MAKLPKAIIKKYGITKKAWQVFRRRKGKNKKVVSMARRRKSFYAYKRNSGMSLQKIAVAGAIYGALGRPLVSKISDMIGRPLGAYTDEAVGATAGYFLQKQKGIIGDVGKVALITEITAGANQLVAPLISGVLGNENNGNGGSW